VLLENYASIVEVIKQMELRKVKVAENIELHGRKEDTLLIMSSGKVNPNLFGDLGPILTSDVPLGNLLLIQLILERYAHGYENVYVTLDKSKSNLCEILIAQFPNLEVFFTDTESSIGKVIRDFLIQYNSKIKCLDILYGDTLTSSLFELTLNRDSIMVSQNLDSNHWDKVTRDNEGELRFLNRGENLGIGGTVSGGFRFTNPGLLLSTLTSVYENDLRHGNQLGSTFYEAIKIYEARNGENFDFVEDIEWQDCGHIDTYYQLRRKLMHRAFRSFNSVALSETSKWVTKSGEKEKIAAEFLWFEKFPQELSHYLPRVSFGINSYSTEFLAALPVSDMWLSSNNDDAYWLALIESLSLMLDAFQGTITNELPGTIFDNKKSVYMNKLEGRIEKLSNLFSSAGLSLNHIQLNSRTTPSFDELIGEIQEVSEKVINLPSWTLIHGDMCFSNLLFERRSKGLKLLDPRGSFGAIGIYGDPFYELLKISQCALGDYDFLTANLFKISISGENYEFGHLNYSSHEWKKEIFGKLLEKRAQKLGITFQELRIMEAGMFISAAPLHTENSRYIALLLKALEVYRDCIST
jgi:hypothetical protein